VSWRGDLVARLRGNSALAAKLGTRIAWFENARSWGDTYPQLVLQEITPGREYTHDGPDGLDEPRVQFDIFALKGTDIEAVEAALLTAMESEADQGGTRFEPGKLEGRRMLPSDDLADQTRVLRLSMDFTFFHHPI
jgi:hypothetical protein